MIKRTVLTLLITSTLLFSSTSDIHASSNFWSYIFRAPTIIQEIKEQKESIFEFINFFQAISQGAVLSSQTQGSEVVNEDNEDVTSETVSDTEIVEITPTPVQSTPTTAPPKPSPKPTTKTVNTMTETDFILSQINNFRVRNGVAPASKDSHTCSFASLRARELASTFDHSGFTNRRSSGSLPYPSWSNVTENIAMNQDHRDVINQWLNSPGHAQNMLADTPYICVGKHGNFYAMVGWKP